MHQETKLKTKIISYWKKKSHKDRKEFILNGILLVAVVVIAFGSVPFLKIINKTDYPIVVVSSGSMGPTIMEGDILLIKWKDPAEIGVGSHENMSGGDIILYETHGLWDPLDEIDQPVVHRVVNKTFDAETGMWYFVTQGDNPSTNRVPDPPSSRDTIPVPEDHIYGVVVGRIPKVGMLKIWMVKVPGFSTILILGIAILLISSILSDNKNLKEEKKKDSLPDGKNLPDSDE